MEASMAMPARALACAIGNGGDAVLADGSDQRAIGRALAAAADLHADLAMHSPIACTILDRQILCLRCTRFERGFTLHGRQGEDARWTGRILRLSGGERAKYG